jgi:hypothetical protein
VDVVLNGVHYQGKVDGNSWTVTVPQADVAKLADGSSYTITADVSDKAGNPAQEANHKLSVDTSATITITNDGSGGDHIFNQNEAGAVNVSGTTTGVEEGRRCMSPSRTAPTRNPALFTCRKTAAGTLPA